MNNTGDTAAQKSRKQVSLEHDKKQIFAGLDIGTTKVAVVIARVQEKSFEIIGVSQVPCTGLRKGVVVNVDATVEAINKAREEAELMAGVKIDTVCAGIAGAHIRSFNSKGMVAIKNHVVDSDDIRRVLETARAVALAEDREIVHALPQHFYVDAQDGVRDPVGMSGVRLEAGVHLVTASKSSMANINKCAADAHLEISNQVLESLASAEAVLSGDEKDLGVAVIDMGGGTSDLIIYVGGAVVYTSVLPIGGTHLTHDISVGLRTPQAEAEEIKKKYGCAMTSLIQKGEIIEVAGVGGRNPRTVSRVTLSEVIEPRVEETLHLLNNEIIKSGYRDVLGSGVVLTGGASLLEGIVELGEFIFEMPVRRGTPLRTSGLTEVVHSPALTTAVGLVTFGSEHGSKSAVNRSGSFIDLVKARVAEFLDGAF